MAGVQGWGHSAEAEVVGCTGSEEVPGELRTRQLSEEQLRELHKYLELQVQELGELEECHMKLELEQPQLQVHDHVNDHEHGHHRHGLVRKPE